MKMTIAFLTLISSLCAFAQERVILDSKEIRINASEAIVVRTSATPDEVKLNFQVPMGNSYCSETAVRQAPGLCTRTAFRTVRETVCVRRNPYNNQCLNSQTRYTQQPVIQRYACMVPESYCARYAVGTMTETDTVKIKFKKLPSLGGTEEETFFVRAQQKRLDSGNVVYDVIPQQTVGEYEVKDRGFLGSDKFVIQPK